MNTDFYWLTVLSLSKYEHFNCEVEVFVLYFRGISRKTFFVVFSSRPAESNRLPSENLHLCHAALLPLCMLCQRKKA